MGVLEYNQKGDVIHEKIMEKRSKMKKQAAGIYELYQDTNHLEDGDIIHEEITI